MVRTINITLEEKALKESILFKVFDTYWAQFEKNFTNIIATTPETEVITKRKDNDIMLDVLSTVRMLDKRLRIIEVNSDKASNFIGKEYQQRIKISINELRTHISTLLELEVPEETIIEGLSDTYFSPRELIRRELQKIKETKEQ